jgi:peptidoglycan/xylan/chitin deacetylase (PgdA/CDA1 family)
VSATSPDGFASGWLGHSRNVPRALYFTFDDGPDPVWTPRILEELARCDVRATFFMIGERVLAQPELAHEVLAGGHDIQLHCHRHVRHTELSDAELQHDCEAALAALAGVGVRPRLWRAPWGLCTDATRSLAACLGLQLVHWSIDTHDWRGDRPQEMLAAAYPLLAGGGAVLMHDALGPGATRAGCSNTVELLAPLAAATRSQGVRLAALGVRTRGEAAGDRSRTGVTV